MLRYQKHCTFNQAFNNLNTRQLCRPLPKVFKKLPVKIKKKTLSIDFSCHQNILKFKQSFKLDKTYWCMLIKHQNNNTIKRQLHQVQRLELYFNQRSMKVNSDNISPTRTQLFCYLILSRDYFIVQIKRFAMRQYTNRALSRRIVRSCFPWIFSKTSWVNTCAVVWP